MFFYNSSSVTFAAFTALYLSLELQNAKAFTPSLPSRRCNASIQKQWQLYTEVEDSADALFFAKVGKKDHVGPDIPETKESRDKSNATSNTKRKPNMSRNNGVQKPKNKRKGNGSAAAKKIRNGKKPATRKNGKKRDKVDSMPLLPLTELKLGSKVEGRVAAFTDFGVFIKINYDLKNKGGAGYALLHKSQIRDEIVDDPKKLFRIGNIVKDLRVITINYSKGEVGLSLRNQRNKRKSLSEFEVGKEYVGKVARVVSYGAFIDLGAKANALLHISRISQKKIENIRNWLNEGDEVTVRLIQKDEGKNTLAASMLDGEADKYLSRRTEQLKKMRERSDEKNEEMVKNGKLKSELEYFEDAVKELENALE